MTEIQTQGSHGDELFRAFRWLAPNEVDVLSRGLSPPEPLPKRCQIDWLRERVNGLVRLRRVLPVTTCVDVDQLAKDWCSHFESRDEVSIGELRSRAKQWLRACEAQSETGRTPKTSGQIERWLSLDQGSLARSEYVPEGPAFSLAVKRACARALMQWQEELASNPHWNQVTGEPTDHPETRSDAFFQRLRLRLGESNASESSKRVHEVTGVEHLFTSASNQCLLVGEPGSGKSALIQWLAWATQQGLIPEFELAIAIRLSDYARYLEQRPQLGLVEFFVASKLNEFTQHRDTAKCLKAAANKSGRFMFLIDGWDEVPPHVRDPVSATIGRDTRDFYTIVTSRSTGSAGQVFGKPVGERAHQSGFYEIIGFEPLRTLEFTPKNPVGNSADSCGPILSLARPESLVNDPAPADASGFNYGRNSLVGQKRTTEKLRPSSTCRIANGSLEMTANQSVCLALSSNSMLRSMVARLLVDQPNFNQAEVFQQVCSWLAEQARETSGVGGAFRTEHLRSLESLAFEMVMSPAATKFTFQEDETNLGPVLPDAIMRSRFIRRVPGLVNRWAFLDIPIQQYLAARQLATLDDETIERHWQRALRAKNRVGVLAFFAGLNPQTQQTSLRLALDAIRTPDRFGLVVVRVARIGAAANWEKIFPVAWRQICDQLRVRANADVTQTPVRSVLQDVVVQFDPPKPTDSPTPLDAREPSAARHALERLVNQDQTPTLSVEETRQLLDQLSQTAWQLDTDDWLSLITGNFWNPGWVREQLTRIAVCELRRESATPAHDPPLPRHVRDHLLSRLMLLPATDVRVLGILRALAGCSIDAGQRLLAAWATDVNAPIEVRLESCGLLATVVDQSLIQSVVQTLPAESSPDMADALFELAVATCTPLDRVWLEKRIQFAAEQSPTAFFRRTSFARLLSFYARTFIAGQARCELACRFVERQISEAIETNEIEGRAIAMEFGLGGSIAWSRSLILQARDFLNRSLDDESNMAGSVGLAMLVLSQEPDWSSRSKRLVDRALSNIQRSVETADREPWDWLASFLASGIADRSLATLLKYPPQTAHVAEALASFSLTTGITIYSRQAFDVEGRCIVDLDDDFISPESGPHVRHNTWSSLPPMQHRAIRSFQLVTEYIGSSATLEEIHATIDTGAEACPAEVRDDLEQLYSGVQFPTLGAWRRSLNHATKKLHASPDGQHLLKELGLPRRSVS